MPKSSLSNKQLLKAGYYTSFGFFTGFFASIISAAVGVNDSKDFCHDNPEICGAHKGGNLINHIEGEAYSTSVGTYLGIAVTAGLVLLGYHLYQQYCSKYETQAPEDSVTIGQRLFSPDKVDCFNTTVETLSHGLILSTFLGMAIYIDTALAGTISDELSTNSFNTLNEDDTNRLNHFSDDVYSSMISASLPITFMCCLTHLCCTAGAYLFSNQMEERTQIFNRF